jgi:hypothetical protein
MRRFLNNLLRGIRSTKAARPARPAPRRAALQVEGLEDRLVMTTAILSGSTLSIGNIAPNHTVELESTGFSNGFRGLEVFDNGALVANPNHLNISSITAVNIQVAGGNPVVVNDSNGMPFAAGTSVDVNGTGTNNVVFLEGSRTVSGNETYVAGSISTLHVGGRSIIQNTPATISLDNNITFVLSSAVASVNDSIPITGVLDVHTSGTQVQLASHGPGGDQYLSGLGNGAGSMLAYECKPAVYLETSAPNASIFLDAPDAAVGESSFTVEMHAAAETTTLDETPKNVQTVALVDPYATKANVAVWGNFGPVFIAGNSSTGVNVGFPSSTGPVTRGIEANVTVDGASSLVVNNIGDVSTDENVTVTEHTIGGTGLFGSPGVTLSYGGVGQIDLLTGTLTDGFTVAPSSPNAVFTSSISISSDSVKAFQVTVDVNAPSHLNLTLGDLHADIGVLVVNTSGRLALPGTFPNGTIDVSFAGQAPSVISYSGFDKVS